MLVAQKCRKMPFRLCIKVNAKVTKLSVNCIIEEAIGPTP